jgi:Tfp pilus assembly protein PilV
MRTFPNTFRPGGHRWGASTLRSRHAVARRLASQQGDSLIEVVIAAMLLALIVAGTLTGLDSTNRSTALQRSRSQADSLAEQTQEQLRSEPIKLLAELESHPDLKTVTEGKTVYTIESKATYIDDSTGTASCSSTAAKAQYLQTTSKVTWPTQGASKPVVESSVISPPPGAALIVQVTESGTPLQGATVTATGPAPETTPHTLETSENGCAILAVQPGEYKINASKPGYIDPNGFLRTEEDASVTRSVYIPAETTAKEGYYLGRPGKVTVTFSGSQGDTFVAFNTGMAKPRSFGTVNSYASSVTSTTTLYPFPTKYTIYAGTCEADKPSTLKSENEVMVPPAGSASTTLTLPQLSLKVYSGTLIKPGGPITGATGAVTDEGCANSKRTFSTVNGAMPQPGLPYGNYSLCVTATVGGNQHRYIKPELHNSTAAGVAETIYPESAPLSGEGC